MAVSVNEWAEHHARHELTEARQAGLSPARYWHSGRAVMLLLQSGHAGQALEQLDAGLRRTGGAASQFVAGLRAGVTLLDGAASIRAMDEGEHVAAWDADRAGAE